MRVLFILNDKEIGIRNIPSPPAVGDEVFTAECPCRVERRKWLELEPEPRTHEVEIYLREIANA